jgi:hypothetical protein
MRKAQTILFGILLAALPSAARSASPEARENVVRIEREAGLGSPSAVFHVRFIQVTDQGEEIPGGEHRDATVLLYFDPSEADGNPSPAGLARPDLRGFSWYLVANCAPEGSRCDPAQPSILLLSNAAFSGECPAQDGTGGTSRN